MESAHALANIITSTAIAAAGVGALVIALRPRAAVLPPRLALASALGLWLLALDEGVELHDRAGRWLYAEHGVVAPGPVNHVDDLFLVAYGLAALAVALRFIGNLSRRPRFLIALIVAGILFVAGTAFDALGTHGTWTDDVEETLEAASALILALAFLAAAFSPVRVAPAHATVAQSRSQARAKGGAYEHDEPGPEPHARLPVA